MKSTEEILAAFKEDRSLWDEDTGRLLFELSLKEQISKYGADEILITPLKK
ncbi:MAG: hypothetical protein Q4B42_07665 [Oscillospiraceae bacterium]|nr:hypothetical protein [Oscillospiraceae bacterium]